MHCVIPCAGLGTRLRPLTLAVPKELLPYGDRPLVQRTVEEALEAGVEGVVIVLRPGKEAVRQHLEAAGLPALYVEQTQPTGLAGAIRAALPAVGEREFIMAIPDQQCPNACAQLMAVYDRQTTLSSMVAVPPTEVELFPGAVGFRMQGSGPLYDVEGLDPNGPYLAFGRTIFGPGFLQRIPEHTDESDWGRIFLETLRSGRHQALLLQGRAADLGTLRGYLHYR